MRSSLTESETVNMTRKGDRENCLRIAKKSAKQVPATPSRERIDLDARRFSILAAFGSGGAVPHRGVRDLLDSCPWPSVGPRVIRQLKAWVGFSLGRVHKVVG
jgi:hypothetical protein